MPNVWKSGNINFLAPCLPPQVCNAVVFHLLGGILYVHKKFRYFQCLKKSKFRSWMKLARGWGQWCPATVESSMFCVPICYWIMKREKIWSTVTWPVFAYGEWDLKNFLSHWERNTGWECQSRVLRNVFGPKRDKVMEETAEPRASYCVHQHMLPCI